MIADAKVSRQIASWGYTSALLNGAKAWISAAKYEAIDERYRNYFMD